MTLADLRVGLCTTGICCWCLGVPAWGTRTIPGAGSQSDAMCGMLRVLGTATLCTSMHDEGFHALVQHANVRIWARQAHADLEFDLELS